MTTSTALFPQYIPVAVFRPHLPRCGVRASWSDVKSLLVRNAHRLSPYADTIEQQVKNALTRVNNLSQAILAKAFYGELTEQWRKDNPDLISGDNSAEALLAKIKAEREAMQPKKKTRAKKMTA